jgi:dUTP pyrophosphatase
MSSLEVKIKRVHSDAKLPSYAKEGDAGMDLTAVSRTFTDESGYGYVEYGTGIALEIPEGYYGAIVPRSSISKTGMFLANSPGTIDSNYRGELLLRFKAIPDTTIYEIGDRIAQLIILPYPKIHFKEVDDLSETDRGDKGFGSTGK